MKDDLGNEYFGLIYKATNIQNRKCYIGQTIRSLESRRKSHEGEAKKGSHKYFHNALGTYGLHNFKWEILGYCYSKEELNESEIWCIEFFQSNNSIYGYNKTNGGEGYLGFPSWNRGLTKSTNKSLKLVSEKQINIQNNEDWKNTIGIIKSRKISEIKKEQYKNNKLKSWNKGLNKEINNSIKRGSEKAKEKFNNEEWKKSTGQLKVEKRLKTISTKEWSEIKGKIANNKRSKLMQSEDWKRNKGVIRSKRISKTRKQKILEGKIIPWNKGQTKETNMSIYKQSLNQKNQYTIGIRNVKDEKNPNSKKVICIDTNEIFNTIKEASLKYNIAAVYIGQCCLNHQKTAGGYKWKYCNHLE